MLTVNLAVFSDDLDPDHIQLQLDMTADTSWRKGERFPPPGEHRKRKRHCWKLCSQEPNDADAGLELPAFIAGLLARVKGRENRFLDLTRSGCNVCLEVWFTSSTIPALHFPVELLITLVALGANVDIDVVMTT